jgi:hypothetical protein
MSTVKSSNGTRTQQEERDFRTTIEYNYNIAKALFDKRDYRKHIRAEILKLIQLQIDLILKHSDLTDKPGEQLAKLKSVFFRDEMAGQGQISQPQILVNRVYKEIETVDEFRDKFINSLNFRELMSMMRNFATPKNDCIMYSILIEYNEAKNTTDGMNTFTSKYPMLNINVVDEAVIMIEKILGFDISETSKCYQDAINNLTGSGKEAITGAACTEKKRFYRIIQDANIQQKTTSPITLCWLWHPLVYGVPYQDVVKLPSDNFVKQLNNSYNPVTNRPVLEECRTNTYSDYPIFPKLSKREQNYLSKSMKLQKNIDGDIINLPWNPIHCTMKRSEPTSFMLNMLDRNYKYSVSNLSGHVMKFIMIAKYFKSYTKKAQNAPQKATDTDNKPINLDMIILASILFMVPYNHSIHEIFQAAKLMGVNTDYSIEKTDLENVNNLLGRNGMVNIDISVAMKKRGPANVNRVQVVNRVPPSKGGMKRKTVWKAKHRTRKHIVHKSNRKTTRRNKTVRRNKTTRRNKTARKYKKVELGKTNKTDKT